MKEGKGVLKSKEPFMLTEWATGQSPLFIVALTIPWTDCPTDYPNS